MAGHRHTGLVAKFLLVFVTAFLLPTTFGAWQLLHHDLRVEKAELTARIGNQAARAALAIERHRAVAIPELARDLIAPLTADRAVECAGIERADAIAPAAVPVTGLECDASAQPVHALALPIGDGETALIVRFSDSALHSEAALRRNVVLGALLVAVVIALFAALAGFRIVVGRRMSNLNAALRRIAEGGERTQVRSGSKDELGQIMSAFNQMIANEARREQALQSTESALRLANENLSELRRESDERFQDFVASASDWYWEMDDQTRFSYFSDRFTEVTGVPKEALLGKTRRETGIPDVDAQAWAQHLDALDNHLPFRNFEHPRVKASGETVWLRINGNPVFDRDGVFRGYRGTGSDVTERVRAMQLVREKALTEETSRAKSEFLANMSHEIRTPINGVLGMAEILLKTSLDAKQRRFAQTIRRSGEALLRVINDILDFSKIEAGKMSLQSAPFNLRELLEDLGELFAESAHGKGLELLHHTPATLPAFYLGDAGRLRQILTNLVGNAIKFTEHGEVAVRVEALDDDGSHSLLRFEVRDTGVGIEVEAQDRVFESFSQADGSTQRRFGGTGLGLTISAQLVALMGGEIGLESTEGEGSAFWFTVRIANAPEQARECAHARMLSGARILVVDDNATNREILDHQLSAWGVESDCVEGGERALVALADAAAEGRPYDLALLDMQMPGMDGLELARRIREDSRICSVETVMLSSVCDVLPNRTDAAAGIATYLLKPVRQSELFWCLDALLNAGNAAAAHAPTNDALQDPVHFDADILLVEDNLVNQEVAVDLLESIGLRVTIAEDGRAGVDAWSSDAFDLIFMDCQMPGMNGYDATRLIRDAENDLGRKPTPIVAMTANALQGDRERCLESGMDDYLSKPFTGRQLTETLRRWLPTRSPALPEPTRVKAPATDNDPVLDPSVLDGFRERERRGRSGLLAKVVGAYLSQSAGHVEQLKQAAHHNDADGVREAAHTLKSSSAQVGAASLSTVCRLLEEAAISGNLDELGGVLENLEALYPAVCSALDAELGRAAA